MNPNEINQTSQVPPTIPPIQPPSTPQTNKRLVVLLVLLLIVGASAVAFWFWWSNSQQNLGVIPINVPNTQNDTNGSVVDQNNKIQMNDNEAKIALVQQIYNAYKNKDVETIKILMKTRIKNLATEQGEPEAEMEREVVKALLVSLNDPTTPLLELDPATLTFTPTQDPAVFLVKARRPQSTNLYDPLTFYDPNEDVAVLDELYISNIDGQWVWVK